jgi:hypothetical protein
VTDPTARESLRAELLRLETALANVDPSGFDVELASLIADDFFEFGASGRRWTASDVHETLATEPPRSVLIEDFSIEELADGVVLATYASEDPRRTYRSSLWVRRDGSWVMRFHQGTLRPPAGTP